MIKSGIIKSDIPEGDIEGMTAEQLRAVVRTMKAENAITREALRKVKRERKEQAPVNPVKRERGPPEVIDLTDD